MTSDGSQPQGKGEQPAQRRTPHEQLARLRSEAFDKWLEEEVPSKPKLRWLLGKEGGKGLAVAVAARLVLFLVFLVRVILEASAKDGLPSTIPELKERPAREAVRGSDVTLEQRPDTRLESPSPEGEGFHASRRLKPTPATRNPEPKRSSGPSGLLKASPEGEGVHPSQMRDPKIEPDNSAQIEAPPKREEAVPARPALDVETRLGDFQRQRERRDRDLSGELSRLHAMEAVVFWIMIVAGVITILLIVLGAIFVFLDKVTAGVITEVMGLMPGAGTLILRRLAKNLENRSSRISQDREDNLRILEAIQATLLNPDPVERSAKAAALAEGLLGRARNRA